MKVKELERFAHSAWSPLSSSRTYLATITAEDNRQSNDSLTDSSVPIPSALEIFEFDVKENNSMSMQSNISLQIKEKGTCLLWTAPIGDLETGLLIYGTITGSLYLYNSQKIISTYHQHQKSSLIDDNNQENIIDFNENTVHHHVNGDQHKWNTTKPSITIAENDLSSFIYTSRENVHNGVVRSLDFNRFQTNLFASVSNDDEIFIWDIEKMEQPMSPGAKIQPLENLNKVAWNPRVQHILCTTSTGRCVIWDLRKSGPVLQLTKTMCQLEPQIMAWSPDVATRLCLTDPNNPNADIQLWDLRYPKHMLALLGHWPPIASHTTSQLAGCPLGNAGTVNSLCWGIPECQKSTNNKSHLYDTDMIMTVIGASGALPTLSGTCGTKLNPTYAEMLVVWSVDQALNSSPDTETSHEATPQPIFISRLEGLEDQELASGLCFNDLPTNMSVHCVPNYPNLLCVTQSDGWITIHNLSSGLTHQQQPQHEQVNVERYAKQCKLARNSQSMRTSHKVAEAFNDGESLTTLDDNIRGNKALSEFDSLYPVPMDNSGITGGGGSGFIDDQQMVNPLIEQLSNDSSYSIKPIIHTIPQPMPLLRVAPCWLKKPCGVNFAFGGRLVIFSSLSQLSKKRTRTLSSMTLKRGDHSKSPETTASGEHQQSITIPSSDHQHQSIPAESQAYCVNIKWIDLSQLESSGDSSSQQLVDNNSSTQEFIDCITNALNCPMEYLLTVCDKAKQLLQTHSYQDYLDLWNIIHARLVEPPSVKLSLSKLFGYDKSDCQNFSGWTTDQLLETLKRSLVTGDIYTTVQLCLHPDFASLSLPNLSTLSVFGVMLADSHQTDQPEMLHEVQTKILTMLNDFPIKHTASSCLNSVIMLFNGVLCKNWSTLVSNWPLSDWRTILSAIINHLWDQDVELFKNLCSLIVKRLLNNADDDDENANKDMKEIHKDLSSNEAGLVACICCIISGNLDGLTQCWLRLNNIDINQLDDVTKILPLALQLVLLHRVSQTNNNSCQEQLECLQSNQLLMNLAIWLADTRGGGQCENNLILALNLLTKTISSSSSLSKRNDLIDLRHRLWCNLSVEQQQQQYQQYCQQASLSSELQQFFQCPYPQTGCHCGLSNPNPSLIMTNKATHQKAMHAQQSSMSTIFSSSTQNLPPQPHLHRQASLQQPIQSTNNFYPPLPSANISNQPVFPSQGMQLQPPLPPPPQPTAAQQPQPYFPSNQNMPFEQYPPAPPPPPPPSAFSHPSMPSIIEQTKNIQLNSNQQHVSPMPNVVKPPIASLSAPMNTNIGNNIPANYQSPFNNMPSSTPQYGVQHQLQSQQSVPLPPPPPPPASHHHHQQQQQPLQRRQTSTSPGWNDPPILSMNKPPQVSGLSSFIYTFLLCI
ncbi:unnamed protein product [Trichobilharzia szidati]|nr:unnamed protein product [Trichobilharzia szidati]